MLLGFDYLKNVRKLTDETIHNFHIGVCDKNGYVYIDSEYPGIDLKLDFRFNNAIWFPIFDLYSNLIGVSARPLENEDKKLTKYVNTVYPKTKHLFGLNFSYKDCFATKKVYVVEGNFDAAMMWQHGIKNVVGMLGSNLTLTQIAIMNRFVDEIVLVQDPDNAGTKFLNNIKKDIPKEYYKLNVKFSTIQLPVGYDPDLFLRTFGAGELVKLENKLFYTLEDRVKSL